MSCLGKEFDVKGYCIRPFYLILGLFCLSILLVSLGVLYFYYYIKSSLMEYIKEVRKERKRYFNKK